MQLLRHADKPAAELGVAIFDYLETGASEARALVLSRLSDDTALDSKLGLASSDAINLRVYDLLREIRGARLGTPVEEITWVLSHGSSNFRVAAMLCQRLGVPGPEGEHQWGHLDRNDLRAFAAALSIAREAAAPLFADECKSRYVDGSDSWLISARQRQGR